MTFALIAALVVTVAAFVWLLDRKDARAHQERERHGRQVAELCQRLQAPDVAVAHHVAQQVTESPQPPNPESDEEYWATRNAIMEIERLEAEANGEFRH